MQSRKECDQNDMLLKRKNRGVRDVAGMVGVLMMDELGRVAVNKRLGLFT